MTDLEYDLTLSIEWMPTRWEDSEAEVDCEETAKNNVAIRLYANLFRYD